MSRLYGLTRRTADALTRKLGEPLTRGGRARSSPAARGVTWVKVTGAASGGWHPGVVSLDDSGTFEDLTKAVQVKALDGGTLATGARYLATRTKDASDGKARFRAASWSYFAEDTPTADYNTPDDNWNDVTGCSITVPEAGRYRVSAFWKATARVSVAPIGPVQGRVRINTTDYVAVIILGTMFTASGSDYVGSAFYAKTLNLAASDVVKLQAVRATGSGTWSVAPIISSQSHLEIARV